VKKAVPLPPVPVEEDPLEFENEVELEEGEMEDEEIEAVPQETKGLSKQVEKKETKEVLTEKEKEQMMLEIEMLQNDGRFRAELLHQLNEMNKALVVIASVLVNISGVEGKEK
jgi:hypothetical protein